MNTDKEGELMSVESEKVLVLSPGFDVAASTAT